MPAYLSGQTKVYQAYGRKRNTHTTNARRVSPFDWDTPAVGQSEPVNKQAQPSSSSADESETDYDEPPAPPVKVVKKAPSPLKRKDGLDKIREKRLAATAASADKENARTVTAAASAAAKGKLAAAPLSAGNKPGSKSDLKGKGKLSAKEEVVKPQPQPRALAAKRPSQGKFLGIFIDQPARTRRPSASAVTRSKPVVPVISVNSTDESETEPAIEGNLNDKFADLHLSDEDDAVGSEPAPARRSGSISEPKLVTYAGRRGRRVAAVADSSTDDESEMAVAEAARKPLAKPTRTRANSHAAPTLPTTASSTLAFPSLLKSLLNITSAGSPAEAAFDFSSFVASPPAPLAGSSSSTSRWRKVGEASFSEVFSAAAADSASNLVVKVIPVSPWVAGKAPAPRKNAAELPLMSDWEAVEREVALSSLLGGEHAPVAGFVRFKGAFLVQGSYPAELLAAWDDFKRAQHPPCDDQIRPDVLPREQVYILIVLEHAGRDLESFKLRSWQEATSVLWQVANVCARAEEAVQFEHRDLHWGNVLVSPCVKALAGPTAALTVTPRKGGTARAESLSMVNLESGSSGVEVTVIDFTLSRANEAKGGVLFDAFEDELIFDGEGDSQFDVYRAMRDHVKGNWEGYHPLTNVMWIQHLATKLLKDKKLKPPTLTPSRLASSHLLASPMTAASPIKRGVGARAGPKSAFGTPKKRGVKPATATLALAPANSALELQAWKLLQEVAAKLAESTQPSKAKKAKKASKKAPSNLGSAAELCAWWQARMTAAEA